MRCVLYVRTHVITTTAQWAKMQLIRISELRRNLSAIKIITIVTCVSYTRLERFVSAFVARSFSTRTSGNLVDPPLIIQQTAFCGGSWPAGVATIPNAEPWKFRVARVSNSGVDTHTCTHLYIYPYTVVENVWRRYGRIERPVERKRTNLNFIRAVTYSRKSLRKNRKIGIYRRED